MQEKLRSATGKTLYAARKQIVEPVFGPIKSARGIRQFLLRGLEKVSAEWQLIGLTHNLLKIWRRCCGASVSRGRECAPRAGPGPKRPKPNGQAETRTNSRTR